jgi:2-polyprenyl-3-methyl-5-hydroxy-6-metoxy-1,4-benzoquinol methylase
MVEVLEHLDPEKLPTLMQVLFRDARPGTVILTTPNREFNARYLTLPPNNQRHTGSPF